jgi:phospholipid/cholesterol/gamma-HCH transport system substrate-binding protein
VNPKLVRRQVFGFIAVAVLVVGYILINYIGLGDVLRPSFTVHAHFKDSGGIFVGAEVDERGIRVGEVSNMKVSPDGVIVDLKLDSGTKVSTALTAAVSDRSALGEQFVQLTPTTDQGPYLRSGSVIAVSETSIPVATETLLTDLDGFAASVPAKSLQTVLKELGTAFGGLGPQLQTLLDSSSKLTDSALADVKNTIALLQASRTVLDTQVASSADISAFSTHLASLADDLRSLDPTLALLFSNGVDAAAQVTNLLDATQQALPVLLNNLITIADVADNRIPQIRKVLVTFPYSIENGLTLLRYCDTIDPKTGKGSNCHYDPKTGLPIYSAHFGLQLSPLPAPCTQGYGGTKKYLPNGQPADGNGPSETRSTPANANAICTASPTSGTPNVRGAQNAQSAQTASTNTTAAYYDPVSGTIVMADGTSFVVKGTSAEVPTDLASMLTMGGSLSGN